MTDREIRLEHEKIHAEISKLIAETAKINAKIGGIRLWSGPV